MVTIMMSGTEGPDQKRHHYILATLTLRGPRPGAYTLQLPDCLRARTGVDGYFFRHFVLNKQVILNAVRSSLDDAAVARWFLQQPGITPARIAEWNRLASLLGVKGHPAYFTRRLVTLFPYPKAITQPVNSLFAAIIQDEGLPPTT